MCMISVGRSLKLPQPILSVSLEFRKLLCAKMHRLVTKLYFDYVAVVNVNFFTLLSRA